MSDDKTDEPGKLITVKIGDDEDGVPQLEHASITDVTIRRNADGSTHLRDSSGSTVGYSAGYAANWDATFGEKPKENPEDLN